ncbi:MAG TPA: hypothetical protein VLI41_09000 [Phenylobacterium sp.]|uniref:hypothetical protein n=1 Tax=Phenylobacterium sp. TaxID=1871053 RepID=UPI002C9744FF|nr:hypothetical protein [Phenylobacterium sp.]HSV03330.1 hypothetical protein [Phenylobacterium sp.]
MPRFGDWKFTVDREATARAYATATGGGADTCDCAWCRNFRLARDKVFPERFLAFLDELGIDYRKDGEVYELCRLEAGFHLYGGWYHFIGRLEETGDFPPVEFGPDFSAHLARANAPRLATLKDAEVVQLEFESRSVPWLLDEPELG